MIHFLVGESGHLLRVLQVVSLRGVRPGGLCPCPVVRSRGSASWPRLCGRPAGALLSVPPHVPKVPRGQPRRNLFSNTIRVSRPILGAAGIRSSCPQSRYAGLCRPLLPCRARMPRVTSSAPARRLRHGYEVSQRPASPAWGSHGIGACGVAVAREADATSQASPALSC